MKRIDIRQERELAPDVNSLVSRRLMVRFPQQRKRHWWYSFGSANEEVVPAAGIFTAVFAASTPLPIRAQEVAVGGLLSSACKNLGVKVPSLLAPAPRKQLKGEVIR